jgi:CheY-like chemotaxis protein
VESDFGKGSRFLVELPASAVVLRTDIAAGAVAESVSISHSHPRLELEILLVEDHTATRDGASRLLREEGATVTEAPDGKTALDLLHNTSFDIVLLDMMLPDFDGREILRMLQDHRPASLRGILVLTGDLTEARVTEIRSLGADGLIGKPIDLPKLLNTLRSFLSVR